jgi:hypothetical protein
MIPKKPVLAKAGIADSSAFLARGRKIAKGRAAANCG